MKNTNLTCLVFKSVVVTLVFLFYLTLNIQAQSPNQEGNFVYFSSFPHQVWGCPDCTGNLPTSKTQIAYGSDYYYFQGNQIINHLDPAFFATLNGGILLGGNFDSQDCRFGMWGYGSYSTDPNGTSCGGLSDKLDVTFSEPVIGKRVSFWGAY